MEYQHWLDKPYYSLNAYFKNTYGRKIYKIAVNAGLSCPNRDGKIDSRGCIFCSKGGSGDFAIDLKEDKVLDVSEQIEKGIKKFNKQAGDKFVIYFQAFTNTYGDIDYLRKIWSEALSHKDVVGISIATRPDCLGKEVLELLSELKKKYCNSYIYKFEDIEEEFNNAEIYNFKTEKFIWIELGLQTIHEQSENYIRRGYPLSVYDEAVKKLDDIGIRYITHIILGLPKETKEMMLDTVRYVNSKKPFGIKLQLLHVLENTDLAKDYRNGFFKELDIEEYIEILIDCLENINPEVVIHRVTGDGPKKILIAPEWSADKKRVLNTLHKRMKELGAYQGRQI